MARPKQQICKRGHDITICGRSEDNHCRECRREYGRKRSRRIAKAAIYKIVNTFNGKIYIGSSVNVFRRWYCHLHDLRYGVHSSSYLQRSWNKHGEESFKFEIIEYIKNPTKENIVNREQFWLDYYQSYLPEKGYNTWKVADSPIGKKVSLEQREKISQTLKRKYKSGQIKVNFKGRHHTKKTKKLSGKKVRVWWSNPENREKMKQIFANPETRKKKLKALKKARTVQKDLRNKNK